ncbi:hypothetical protein F2Q70_00025792 [Brassica cretica]|uniref:Uncharacterized protein n=1 Tax=Brassica cretica TaxID=69181 RepID=A0A8S9J6A9_BRACR|nr:hypothetical protein F2Q68_00006735 [Brassica cretica]KAF2601682.1 hypothetical protein F2Q70_00025792 [Brassica cretica]
MVENGDTICILVAESSQFKGFRRKRGSTTRFSMGAGLRSLLSCIFRGFPMSGAQLVGDRSCDSSLQRHDANDSGFFFADVTFVYCSLGRRTIERVLKLPIERRQVPFLVRRETLERCSIWGSRGEEALAEYKRAFEVMLAKKAAPKRAALSENDDEVQFIKSNKRQAMTALASSSTKKSKASGSTPKAMSQLFHLGERMDDHTSLRADLAALTSQL